MKHFRTDLATFKEPVITPAGYLQADAFITRCGVFDYADSLGRITRELRHPDDVFDTKSLETARLVPVTDLHPQFPVNSGTAAYVQRGSTGDTVKRDGDFVRTIVGVTDSALLERVRQGQHDLSMGYECELVAETGVWVDADGKEHPYDARQKNIRYDHCAVVPKGRAGDEVRLRVDGKHSRIDAASIRKDAGDGDPNPKGKTMKIKVDGIEIEVSDTAGQVIEGAIGKRDAEIKTANAATETEKGRADAAEAKAKDEEKKRTDAQAPSKVQELVKARVALEATASKLGVEKVDTLDDAALKRACIAKVHADMKLDGQSDAYVDGVFASISGAVAKSDGLDALRRVLTPAGGGGNPQETKDAYDDLAERQSKKVDDARKAAGAK